MYDECDGFNAGETLNRTEVNVLEYDECDECDECDGFNAGGSATLTRVILIVITNWGDTVNQISRFPFHTTCTVPGPGYTSLT